MVYSFLFLIAPVPAALCGHEYDKLFNISHKIVTYLVALLNMWADDPVRRHNRFRWRGCWGRRGLPPPEGHQTEGREGGGRTSINM